MKAKKGFTLIELMIVIVIIGILAAIAVPLLLSRVERSKYAEGKTIAGQVATALRAFVAEHGTGTTNLTEPVGGGLSLGFESAELDGKYFAQGDITISDVSVNDDGTLDYTITIIPLDSANLTKGNLVLTCLNNVTTFEPSGM